MNSREPIVSRHRLEALADGVFAIAMTILVLEVKVPELHDPRSSAALFASLHETWPTVATYFLSFFMLGLYWVWHHRLISKVLRLDAPLLVLSFLFLALVSFFPFAAGVLGRYPANAGALLIYLPTLGAILLTQTAFFALAQVRGCLDPGIPAAQVLGAHVRNLRGCGIFFLAAFPAALRSGWSLAFGTLALGTALLLAAGRLRKRG